jgi:hypothetical protein
MFWRRFLHRWAGGLPTRIIEHDGEPLFERSVVFSGCVPFVGHCTVYLHHYLRSDPDRGVHDHPWDWAVSIPLAAGYTEQRLAGVGRGLAMRFVRRQPLLPYRLTGRDFHRVLLPDRRTSWSLFVTGPNVKGWGFLRAFDLSSGSYALFSFTPHLDDSGSHTKWWRTAPLGRTLDRAAP